MAYDSQAQNPNGWDSLRRMLANPQLGAAMIQTGLGFLRDRAPFESGWSKAASAVGGGLETFGRAGEIDRENQRGRREDERLQATIDDQNLDRELRRQEYETQSELAREGNAIQRERLAQSASQFGMVTPGMMFEAQNKLATSLLGQTDIDGVPLYTPETAMETAKKWFTPGGGSTTPSVVNPPETTSPKGETPKAPTTSNISTPPKPILPQTGNAFLDTPLDLGAGTMREIGGIYNWFTGGGGDTSQPATPKAATGETTTNIAPGVPTVSTKEEYDALPSGASYYHAGKKQVLIKG